ncbi:MAG: SIMPL domain-containing protein [Oscillospiraceae bacterium]|nr:SIMPL domain-containing protein [Oscillospiraceae bacterium]
MRTICVTGKGRLRLRPDLTSIAMTLEALCPEYGDALRCSSEETEQLAEVLGGFGFARGDLKTLSFSADPEYEGYEEQGVYHQRLAGYRYRHIMKLEYPSDNERLGKLLYALAHAAVRPEVRISYTVSDPERAKNELLGRAVADASGKAAVLARAAGVTLKEIQSVSYAWDQPNLEVQPVNRMLLADARMAPKAAGGSYDLGMEPENIEVSDAVTVIWEIGR